MGSRLQRNKDIRNRRIMGVIAITLAIGGFIFPKAWLMLATVGVILGGEARVSKDLTTKTLGIISEIIIGIEIVMLYAWAFSLLG